MSAPLPSCWTIACHPHHSGGGGGGGGRSLKFICCRVHFLKKFHVVHGCDQDGLEQLEQQLDLRIQLSLNDLVAARPSARPAHPDSTMKDGSTMKINTVCAKGLTAQ